MKEGYPNNLKKLREIKGLDRKNFAKEFKLSIPNLKNYENEYRNIPSETAVEIADAYNVTVDWLFCRGEYNNKKKSLSKILYILRKIFQVKVIQDEDIVLSIDKRFRQFLSDIDLLNIAKSHYLYDDNAAVNSLCEKVYEKHKKKLEQIFIVSNFKDNFIFEIDSINDEYFSMFDDNLVKKLSEETETETISIKTAMEIANKDNVTLDWLFHRSNDKNEIDSLCKVLYTLRKVFRVKKRRDSGEILLFIDKRFRNFLFDVDTLIIGKSEYLSDDNEAFTNLCNEIYKKHREYLEQIFTKTYFEDNFVLEIDSINDEYFSMFDDCLINYLSEYMTDDTIATGEKNILYEY